jgi:hypothetical protein
LEGEAFGGREGVEEIGLALAVDDGGDDLAGDEAVADVEGVGVEVVDAESLLEDAAEEGEAAGEDRRGVRRRR